MACWVMEEEKEERLDGKEEEILQIQPPRSPFNCREHLILD